MPTKQLIFCGDALPRYRDELSALLSAEMPRIAFGRFLFPSVSAVAALGWQQFESGEPGEDALELVPLYIAPPPISLPKTAFAQPT